MGVEVYINVEVLVCMLLDYHLFHSVNSRLSLRTRVYVVAIQILGKCIESPVATIHTIRIQHGHNFKHELLEKNFCLLTLF